MIRIVPLSSIPASDIETLLDSAFGTDRHQRTAYRLREGTEAIADLSFAVVDDSGSLIGSIQSWPVYLNTGEGKGEALIMVGPVAIDPALQRGGVGQQLTRHMLAAADARGDDALMLIGDPEYYDRFFGFTAEHTGKWSVPGPVEQRRLLARLSSDRLVGLTGMLGPHILR